MIPNTVACWLQPVQGRFENKEAMENPEVAQAFDEVADMLELQEANLFRVRAYRTASPVPQAAHQTALRRASGRLRDT